MIEGTIDAILVVAIAFGGAAFVAVFWGLSSRDRRGKPPNEAQRRRLIDLIRGKR